MSRGITSRLFFRPSDNCLTSSTMTSTFNYHYWKFSVSKRAQPTFALATGTWTNATPTIGPGVVAYSQ